MSSFLSGLLVTMVLILVAASYPAPVARGGIGLTPEAEKGTANSADAGEALSLRPSSEGADRLSASREEAMRTLARLKPGSNLAPLKTSGTAVALPSRIRIPAIGLDTGFEFVGLAANGAMDVPQDPNQVAWYRLGPRPGELGNAVVAGHVDWGGNPAAFWDLRQLAAGDTVEVVTADDREYEFVVQWQQWYDADRAPVEEVFGQSSGTEITLITCGGVFDRKSRQYLSRLVVRAVLR